MNYFNEIEAIVQIHLLGVVLTLELIAVRSLSPSFWRPLYFPREKTVHSFTNWSGGKKICYHFGNDPIQPMHPK